MGGALVNTHDRCTHTKSTLLPTLIVMLTSTLLRYIMSMRKDLPDFRSMVQECTVHERSPDPLSHQKAGEAGRGVIDGDADGSSLQSASNSKVGKDGQPSSVAVGREGTPRWDALGARRVRARSAMSRRGLIAGRRGDAVAGRPVEGGRGGGGGLPSDPAASPLPAGCTEMMLLPAPPCP